MPFHPRIVRGHADQVTYSDKGDGKKEPKRTLREMIFQSNGNWVIVSQVTNPNSTKHIFS